MQDMTTRSGHYTALLETIGARGATKLHADERDQLLAVADALLFGDPDSEQGLARALDLITRLRESERWSAESCAELREHLSRLRTAPRGGLNEAAARVRPIKGGSPHGRRAAGWNERDTLRSWLRRRRQSAGLVPRRHSRTAEAGRVRLLLHQRARLS